MTPSVDHIALEEHEKFSGFLRGILETAGLASLHDINWYRIVLSAELVIPRALLLVSVGGAYLALDDSDFGRNFLGCHGIQSKEKLLYNIQENFLAICDPVIGLCIRPCLYRLIGVHLYSLQHDAGDSLRWTLPIQDSIDCLMREFITANRLWVRHRYAISDHVESHRRQLQHLVAQPIKMMAALPELCVDRYKNSILPILLEHIVASKDDMAQEYMTAVILESFPISFHLETVVALLDSISHYVLTVDIKLLVSVVIDRILVRPESTKQEQQSSGDVFDALWERIAVLLTKRVETAQAEEAILLCTPLLHSALGMKPFNATRVDVILEFIHVSVNQASAYVEKDRITLAVRKIVDLVLESIVSVQDLFALAHLFSFLSDVDAGFGASLGLSLVGKLVEMHYKAVDQEEQSRLLDVFRIIIQGKGQLGGDCDPVEMIENVKIQTFVADSLFNNILAGQSAQVSTMFINVLLDEESMLSASVMLPMAVSSMAYPGSVTRPILQAWKKLVCSSKTTIPLVNQVIYEEQPDTVRGDLSYFLRDSSFKVLAATWCRLIEAWKTEDGASDFVYESIVEVLVMFEEDVTDHRIQVDILRLVISALRAARAVISKTDMGVLIGKLHGYGKRLLKTDERLLILFELIELGVVLGGQLDATYMCETYASLLRLMPIDIADTSVLSLKVRATQALLGYMKVTEPITVCYHGVK